MFRLIFIYMFSHQKLVESPSHVEVDSYVFQREVLADVNGRTRAVVKKVRLDPERNEIFNAHDFDLDVLLDSGSDLLKPCPKVSSNVLDNADSLDRGIDQIDQMPKKESEPEPQETASVPSSNSIV